MQEQITWENFQLSYKQDGYMQGGETQTHTCKLIWKSSVTEDKSCFKQLEGNLGLWWE